VMNFDYNELAWKQDLCGDILPGNQSIAIRMDAVMNSSMTSELVVEEQHKRFLELFEEKWRTNESLMITVNAICLFEPARPNVINVLTIRGIRQIYCDLLKRQLLMECMGNRVACELAYNGLMGKFGELTKLNEGLQRLYAQFNPDDLAPLIQELYLLR